MLVPITIDTQALVDQFALTNRQVEGVLDDVIKSITAQFARSWEEEAKRSLKRTRKRYINSLGVVDEGRMQGAVVLRYNDPVVKFVEEGRGAFDMKVGFERSDKRKEKKDGGWYLTIPFRIATPDAIAESDLFANRMPSEIYELVKDEEIDVGFNRSPGLSIKDIPDKYSIPKTRAAVGNVATKRVFEEYQRKTSEWEGLSKVQDRVTGQNVYMNFRVVSDQSDPNAWIYTGINAYQLGDKAFSIFESGIDVRLNKALNFALENVL